MEASEPETVSLSKEFPPEIVEVVSIEIPEELPEGPESTNLMPWLLAAQSGDETAALRAALATERAEREEAERLAEERLSKLRDAQAEIHRIKQELPGRNGDTTAQSPAGSALREESEALAVRVAEFEQQLSAAKQKLLKNQEELSKTRRTWMSVAGVSALLSIALVMGAPRLSLRIQTRDWFAPHRQTGSERAPEESTSRLSTTARSMATREITAPVQESVKALAGQSSSQQVTVLHSVSRLAIALAQFGGQDPEEILKRVNQARPASALPVCAFEWRDGQPSLVLDVQGGKLASPENAITQCAAAVERYH